MHAPAALAQRAAPSGSAAAGSTEISARPTGCPRPCSRCRSSRLTPASPTSASSRASSPGCVRDQRPSRRVCRRRAAVLARDPRVAGVAAGHDRREHRRGRPSSPSAARRQRRRARRCTSSRSARSCAQHLAHGRGVAGEDLGPQRRVAGRDPGDVAQSLAGQGHRACRAARAAGRRPGWRRPAARARPRRRRRRARPGVIGRGAAPTADGQRRAPPRRPASADRRSGATTHGGPSNRSRRRRDRARALAPGHRVGAHVARAGRRRRPCTLSSTASLDRRDVGDHRLRPRGQLGARPRRRPRPAARRRRPGPAPRTVRRASAPGAEVPGQRAARSARGRAATTRHPARVSARPEAGADQPGADDAHVRPPAGRVTGPGPAGAQQAPRR